MKRFGIELKWNQALLSVFSVLLISGCAVQAAPVTKEERSESGLRYEMVKPPYPSFLEKAMEAQKQKKAATVIQKDDHAYVIITLGQRPSAGYKVVVDRIEKKSDQIVIHYSEKKPEGMAASVITFPSLVLKIPETNLPVYVQKQN